MVPFPAKAIMLLIADYQQNRESAMKGDKGGMADDEFTGETVDTDDGDDWDDQGDGGFDGVGFDDEWGENLEEEDDTDPELINQGVYNLNMTEYLSGFLQTCAASNISNFGAIADQVLDHGEKKILKSIIS
ncbi:hypothetical protein BC830DRAFT_654586 [Chytriomyces sp. MP71]|nr:hypothetical protein BC830DRAFT_654586 [Chytriomyces sp. MP71]